MTRARDIANLIGSGNYSSTTFTATAGQTAFTISHTQGFVQVFMNGLLLDETVDYTSNGTAITLTSGAAAGDEIEVVAYNTFSVGDALNTSAADSRYYTQSAADTRYVNTTGDTMTGNLLLSSGSIGVGTTSPLRQLSALNTSGNAEVSLVSGTSNQCSILMGDGTTGTDLYKGYLQYDNITDGMLIATNATSRININSSGYVNKPYQPYIELRGNNGSRITNHGTPVIWTHFSQQIAVGITWNSSTGRITVPIAGKYFFTGKFYQWIDNATNQNVLTRLNGNTIAEYHSDYAQLGNGNNTDHVLVTSDIINMAANDYIEYRVNSDIYGGYPHCNLQGWLLG